MESMEAANYSDDESGYDALHTEKNRRGKKAGGWQVMGLDHPVFKAIERMGYKQPTPIQRKAIPSIMDGKDVVAMSRTGSGKTAAFVIPMIQKLKQRFANGTRALLLSPTRELAMQTFSVVKKIAKFTGLRCACLVGGDNMDEQFDALHQNPDILIATPGRLLHVCVEMNLKFTSVKYIVFDEADRLFEMGFAEQLHDILKRLPENRQTLLFSATLPKLLIDFAKAGLSDPTLIRLDVDSKLSEKLSMVFISCRDSDKLSALLFLARKAVKEKEQTIVFCATMKHVEYVSTILREAGLDCCFLYSQLDPTARKMNITRFRNKQCNLLIVTDVAARGVDIPLLDNAINFHFPPKAKLFVHRVGRVARAGKSGRSYNLVSPDEVPYMLDLFLFLGRGLSIATDTSVYDSDDAMLGGFPDDLVHLETEFLRNLQETSMEVSDLKYKSDNAMKKYIRTRPQPSAESVRRAKNEFKSVDFAAHPILKAKELAMSADFNVLQELKNYRPAATIFEMNQNTKMLPAEVMKKKRKSHGKLLKRKAENTIEEVENDVEEPETEGVKVIVTPLSTAKPKSKRAKYEEQKERDRMQHYVSYTAADDNTEKAFALDTVKNSFDAQAKSASVDIVADDEKGLYKEKDKKKWDRKTKKYVGEQTKKRIRTEEGTLVPATYKSGRYEKWQQSQKIKFRNRDDEEEDDGNAERESRARKCKKVWHTKGVNKGGPRDELKTPEQIFKSRQKRAKIQDYQTHRHRENLKKKVDNFSKKSSRSSLGKRSGSSGRRGPGKPSSGRRGPGKPSSGRRGPGKPSFGRRSTGTSGGSGGRRGRK